MRCEARLRRRRALSCAYLEKVDVARIVDSMRQTDDMFLFVPVHTDDNPRIRGRRKAAGVSENGKIAAYLGDGELLTIGVQLNLDSGGVAVVSRNPHDDLGA
jgi:hypothetical protein